jgi:ABC-type branched-subunit amino acid transport system permease subunit
MQINFWPNEPENQGLWYYGATIPCIETVNVNPTVKLTPLEGGFPVMYVIIGAGAAAVAVIVALLVLRRRGSKPS